MTRCFAVSLLALLLGAGAGRAADSLAAPARTLFVLSVGIDDYSPYPLAMAAADARAIAQVFPQVSGRAFGHVETTLLINQDATLPGIRDAVRRIARQADPADTFLFHFSGMGRTVATGTGRPQSCLLTYAKSESPDEESQVRAGSLLTAAVLKDLCVEVPCKHEVVVIDACWEQVGDFSTALAKRNRSLGDLGSRCLTVLSAGPIAFDVPKLHHGALTGALLEGLQGADLAGPADGRVTLGALTDYVLSRVPSLTGARQHPHVLSEGEQRNLALAQREEVSGEDKRAPGNEAKPPQLRITSPEATRGRATVASASVLLRGQAIAETGVDRVTVNGLKVRVDDNGEFVAEVSLDPGENEVTVKATDTRGMVMVSKLHITRGEGVPTPAPIAPGHSYALVIGADEYGDAWPRLGNPIFDAETLAGILKDRYGFEVTLLKNPGKKGIEAALRAAARRPYEKQDQFLLFFAGHGYQDPDTLLRYIVPSDAKSLEGDRECDSFIPLSCLRDTLDNLRCRHVMLVLDSCFGGTFDSRIAVPSGDQAMGFRVVLTSASSYRSLDPGAFVERKLALRTRQYITSGGRDYVPDGRPGAHSPFAAKLVEALESSPEDGVLTFYHVADAVAKVDPLPFYDNFGRYDPGSTFLFISKELKADASRWPTAERIAWAY